MTDLDGDLDNDVISGSSHNGSGEVFWYRNDRGPADAGESPPRGGEGDSPSRGDAGPNRIRVFPDPSGFAPALVFTLAEPAIARLAVFDVQGRKVRTLVEGERPVGPHRVTWDGRDEAGRRVATGLYFCRLEAEGTTRTRKMVFLQ